MCKKQLMTTNREGKNGNMRAFVATLDRNVSHVLKKVVLAANLAQDSCMWHWTLQLRSDRA
jgi:hypothetical protein